MKHIFLITTTAALFAQVPFCFAQLPTDPVAVGATPGAGQSTSSSRAKRSTPPTISVPGNGYGTASALSGSKGDSIPPVMIRFSQPDAKTGAGLEEDLFVMARVISRTLDKADAESGKVPTKLGISMLLTGSGRSVRPMYIEGMGPLFMIKVSFPLQPPAKVEETAGKPAVPDSEWNEARLDVFGNSEFTPDESASRVSSYNEEQVEMLKKELIGSLKNAANIRGLAPSEFVNIAVFGQASSTIYSMSVPDGDSGGNKYSVNARAYLKVADVGAAKGTVLTLRAKKSDIDAFAVGKLDADGFRAKVTVTSYTGSGVGSSSINSWIQEKTGSRFQ